MWTLAVLTLAVVQVAVEGQAIGAVRRPGFCSILTQKGPCRASYPKFRYNEKLRACESFTYGGCPGIDGIKNMFSSLEECNKVCFRTDEEERAFSNGEQECTFEVNLGRTCELDPVDFDIINCGGQKSDNYTKSSCLNRGCCWYDQIDICFQRKNVLAAASCGIDFNDNQAFRGKIVFQVPGNYPARWAGILTFNKKVAKELCILSDQYGPSYTIDESFGHRTRFVVSGPTLYAGQSVTIPFTGSYHGQSSSFRCQSRSLFV